MRGDPWHREPPLAARTVEEVSELGSALHDCWIDIEGLTHERQEQLPILSLRVPLALDNDECELDVWPWELVIRNPSSIAIEDSARVGVYSLNTMEAEGVEVIVRAEPDLAVHIGVRSLNVAVARRAS